MAREVFGQAVCGEIHRIPKLLVEHFAGREEEDVFRFHLSGNLDTHALQWTADNYGGVGLFYCGLCILK